ncbi:lysophospholipid acyltransferase family protein [Mesomycoplasma neurolyticum]|uniref:1-acyl-sn-glycerol-3-phosphate acyltransferase n=1 Tax=Mesomycoplasma neurolyticum TaxID=2120 RepID=A0A449A630_9BACT|nr:lysophospholipid acyltransferase family protein [Mesomycoplasma neurolyticum]VEU59715.1 1-acyl-sn-glycerol-3-phosphate acyltransferase [Mesomycoplasma neurolyticum]
MLPRIKLILLSPIWLFRLNKLRKLAKKYRKNKLELNAQARNNLILKYSSKILKIYNVKVNVINPEAIPKSSSLIMANHLSNADAFILFNALQANLESKDEPKKILTFLAKTELQRKRTIKNILSLIDTFFIDRTKIKESVKTLENFGKFVKDNKTYGVVFPEGTRSKDGNMQEFKKAPFSLAKKSLLNILPVTINYSGDTFNSLRSKQLVVDVYIHPLIKSSTISMLSIESLKNKTFETIASKYIPSTPEKNKK